MFGSKKLGLGKEKGEYYEFVFKTPTWSHPDGAYEGKFTHVKKGGNGRAWPIRSHKVEAHAKRVWDIRDAKKAFWFR